MENCYKAKVNEKEFKVGDKIYNPYDMGHVENPVELINIMLNSETGKYYFVYKDKQGSIGFDEAEKFDKTVSKDNDFLSEEAFAKYNEYQKYLDLKGQDLYDAFMSALCDMKDRNFQSLSKEELILSFIRYIEEGRYKNIIILDFIEHIKKVY